MIRDFLGVNGVILSDGFRVRVFIALFLTYTASIFLLSPRYYSVSKTPSWSSFVRFPGVLGMFVEEAEAQNIDPYHILAISAQESSLGKFQLGDGGCSKGYFHINTCFNDFDGIGDPKKEVLWVIERLKEYGYHNDPRLAVAKYNAPNRPNFNYADKVLGARLLEVKSMFPK